MQTETPVGKERLVGGTVLGKPLAQILVRNANILRSTFKPLGEIYLYLHGQISVLNCSLYRVYTVVASLIIHYPLLSKQRPIVLELRTLPRQHPQHELPWHTLLWEVYACPLRWRFSIVQTTYLSDQVLWGAQWMSCTD